MTDINEPCYECGSTERMGTACAPCNPEITDPNFGMDVKDTQSRAIELRERIDQLMDERHFPAHLFDTCEELKGIAEELSTIGSISPEPSEAEWFGVTGASNETEALAVALFAVRCPGIRMTDEDLHYYSAAARRAMTAVESELSGNSGEVETSVEDAVDRIRATISDLQSEHEVMAGPFDPEKWLVDVKVSDLQILLRAQSRSSEQIDSEYLNSGDLFWGVCRASHIATNAVVVLRTEPDKIDLVIDALDGLKQEMDSVLNDPSMTRGNPQNLSEDDIVVYHVGAALQSIADTHSDTLTPRDRKALYIAAEKLWEDDTQEEKPYGWIYEKLDIGPADLGGLEWYPARFTKEAPHPERSRNVIALYTKPVSGQTTQKDE